MTCFVESLAFSFFLFIIGTTSFRGGDFLINEEIRKVITYQTLLQVFIENEEYFYALIRRVTNINVKQLGKWLETVSFDMGVEEFEKRLDELVVFSCSSNNVILNDFANTRTYNCWLFVKNSSVLENCGQVNIHFTCFEPLNFRPFLSMEGVFCDRIWVYDNYIINLDCLYDCDEDSLRCPDSLEYLCYPFVCFEPKKLNQIYKEDAMMLGVIKTIQEQKENAYVIGQNYLQVDV